MKVKVTKENKNRRCSRALTRFFNKIGDLYVKMMYELANQVESAGVNVATLPKSFSMRSTRLSSGDQDLVELVRLASRRGLAKKVESEFLRQRSANGAVQKNDGLYRGSVGMGKIDEDETCDYGGSDGFKDNRVNFPRSTSHVVLTRKNEAF
ncbi:hypothetical protein L2E82_01124 [Cichorium intybus]|uniref:Uncharacterized protein n=1 Tax=Cichorium intybus TaxID=13427 RepID=A0ACB9GY31_CICIN|nr:hypothetical protein L2E82_01124 [Cichorium intybus]